MSSHEFDLMPITFLNEKHQNRDLIYNSKVKKELSWLEQETKSMLYYIKIHPFGLVDYVSLIDDGLEQNYELEVDHLYLNSFSHF